MYVKVFSKQKNYFFKIFKKTIDTIRNCVYNATWVYEIEQILESMFVLRKTNLRKEVFKMFPNFSAEYSRRGFTLEKLAEEMEKRGCKRTVPTLSQKLNGKYTLTLDEAKILRDIVAPQKTIDVLFSEEAIED